MFQAITYEVCSTPGRQCVELWKGENCYSKLLSFIKHAYAFWRVPLIIKLTFGLFITRSINITRGCTRSPLSKLQHTYCFLPVSPDKSPGPDTNKSFCLLSLVLPHKEYSVSLHLKCSNCHVKTNSLSVFLPI